MKVVVDIVAGPIANMMNKSIQTSHFPNSPKFARVEPIYKGGSTTDINNYRPVSILPLLSKFFERVVFNRLYNFLEKYKILTDEHFRFRWGKSKTWAFIEQTNYIFENPDVRNIVFRF